MHKLCAIGQDNFVFVASIQKEVVGDLEIGAVKEHGSLIAADGLISRYWVASVVLIYRQHSINWSIDDCTGYVVLQTGDLDVWEMCKLYVYILYNVRIAYYLLMQVKKYFWLTLEC